MKQWPVAAHLVHDEARRECGDTTSRHCDRLTADRTPERPDHRATSTTSTSTPGSATQLGVDDMFQTALTDGV